MPIVLHIDSTDPALREHAGQRLEVADRLTVGRGSDNDLVLADPNRHLSKNHCVIAFDGRGYTVTDTSTNGVFLDNQPERLPRDVPTPLHDGSLLRLGSYEITVAAAVATAAPGFADPGHGGGAPPPYSPPPHDDPLFGDPFAASPVAPAPQHGAFGASAADDNLFGFGSASPPAPLAAPIAPAPAGDPFGASSAPGAAGPLIPDDVDLFGDAAAQPKWQGPSQADNA